MSGIFIYTINSLGVQEKVSDTEMLLYPPKKKSHLPVLFAQHGDVSYRDIEVVNQERDRSFKIESIVNQPSMYTGIPLFGLISVKMYRLIKKDIIVSLLKFFKYLAITINIGVVKISEFNLYNAKSQMVSLIFDRVNDTH